MRVCLGTLVLCLVSVACTSSGPTLSQADIDAIRAASKSYEQSALKADFAKMASTFEPDGMMLPANAPLLNGVSEIEKWGRAFPPITKLTLEPLETVGDGTTAWVRGRYSFVMAPPGQPEVSDTGKYIEIWRKQQDGSWKIHRDIFNSDLPPAPPAASVALADDPILGTWVLNVSKSKYVPGPPPRSETRSYVLAGNVIDATSKRVEGSGNPVNARWSVTYDGTDRPQTGNPDADMLAVRRIDAFTVEFTERRGGKVVVTGSRVTAQDGKTMTISSKGTNAAGQRIEIVEVFEKR